MNSPIERAWDAWMARPERLTQWEIAPQICAMDFAEAELTTLRASLEQAQKELQSRINSTEVNIRMAKGEMPDGLWEASCGTTHVAIRQLRKRAERAEAELDQVRGAWVSVEERLPEIDENAPGYEQSVKCIAMCSMGVVPALYERNAYAKSERWKLTRWKWYGFGRLLYDVTHWQPLPAPPSPSKEGT